MYRYTQLLDYIVGEDGELHLNPAVEERTPVPSVASPPPLTSTGTAPSVETPSFAATHSSDRSLNVRVYPFNPSLNSPGHDPEAELGQILNDENWREYVPLARRSLVAIYQDRGYIPLDRGLLRTVMNLVYPKWAIYRFHLHPLSIVWECVRELEHPEFYWKRLDELIIEQVRRLLSWSPRQIDRAMRSHAKFLVELAKWTAIADRKLEDEVRTMRREITYWRTTPLTQKDFFWFSLLARNCRNNRIRRMLREPHDLLDAVGSHNPRRSYNHAFAASVTNLGRLEPEETPAEDTGRRPAASR